MENFINEDFLLQSEPARRLYHDYAAQMPIIDYHCHLPPSQIAEDKNFRNMTAIWLYGDHYKWRAMRALGVDEKYITGDASDEEKFQQWATAVPYALRSPLYHWTHLELKDPFGITSLLNKDNANEIYARCNELLRQPEFTPGGLLNHFNVKTVCTTDDPCDDLHDHDRISKGSLSTKVLPAFRPDKVLQIAGGDSFRKYIGQLGHASGIEISDLDHLLDALQRRVDYFHEKGGRLSDHGLSYIPAFNENDRPKLNDTFKKVLNGNDAAANETAIQDNFAGYVLYELCKMYHAKGWTQQFHVGALRNANSAKLNSYGPDTGFDSIGDYPQAATMATFFDKLEQVKKLTQTILYNLNPADNEVFATMAGNFNEGPGKGKMQYGSAWWFLDQLDGMEKQINALSNMGILSSFVGMLTDSRSFLSYSRHEYFRRLLCNMFGRDVQDGILPNDLPWLGSVIQDICYNNAKNYFNF